MVAVVDLQLYVLVVVKVVAAQLSDGVEQNLWRLVVVVVVVLTGGGLVVLRPLIPSRLQVM
jgi:hypothetical protein